MSLIIEKARPEDASALLEYLKAVGGESDSLTFGAEGLPVTPEEEEAFPTPGPSASTRGSAL